MGRTCEVTGKRPKRGRSIVRRGIAKKKKGIGLNITGICKRNFRPNLFKKRFWHPEEKRFITLQLSAAAIRTIEKNGIVSVVHAMRKDGAKI